MYTVITQELDGFSVVAGFSFAVIDPAETTKKIEQAINDDSSLLGVKMDVLLKKYAVYFRPKRGETIISSDEFNRLYSIYSKLTTNQLLTESGEVIDNYKGVEYWLENSGCWKKFTIEKIGFRPPDGAKYEIQLTNEEKQQIEEQIDRERILKLTKEEKEAEKKQATEIALSKAAMEKVKYEILGNPKAAEMAVKFWNDLKAEIDKKYN